jgi:DNA gyrase subunit A
MIINKSGIVIRIVVSGLRVMGRATQGVRLINLKGNDAIASVASVDHEDDVEIDESVLVDPETAAAEVLEDGTAEAAEDDKAEDVSDDDESADDAEGEEEEN